MRRDVPPDFADFKESVFQDSTQDWLGVYEVWWEANQRYPSWPLSERLAIAERVLSELLAEGRVRLFRRPWGSETHEPVADSEVDSLLGSYGTWVPRNAPEPMVWLTSVDNVPSLG